MDFLFGLRYTKKVLPSSCPQHHISSKLSGFEEAKLLKIPDKVETITSYIIICDMICDIPSIILP